MVADTRFAGHRAAARRRWPRRCCRCSARWPCRCRCGRRRRLPARPAAGAQRESAARGALAAQAERAARAEQLAQENERLRALLELRPALARALAGRRGDVRGGRPVFAQGLHRPRRARTAWSRGAPVINEAGVLGQVTRVYALTSEVTLLTDKDAAIPVLNTRTQQRSAAFGGGRRPAGRHGAALHVRQCRRAGGRRAAHQRRRRRLPAGAAGGARVPRWSGAPSRASRASRSCPPAPPDGVRHVLVLEPLALQLPPRPEPRRPAAPAPERAPGRRRGRAPARAP